MRELHPLGKVTFPYSQPNIVANPANNGTGYYGNFYDSTNQTIASTTTAYAIGINTTISANGVSIASGSRIVFDGDGTYNLQLSIQFTSTDTSIHDVQVWLRKNGVDVPYSNAVVSIPNKHGTDNGRTIAAWNLMFAASAGDYFELMWSANSTAVSIETIAAGTSPTTPISPGVIVTVQQLVTGGAGGGAPVNASYLTLGTNATLTSERVLTAGTGISLTDGGAGGNLTVASTVTGTVTSVAMTVPSILSLSGTPITTSGTLAVTLATQTANTHFLGPASGSAAAPTFRSMVAADLPAYVMSHMRRRATSHPARGGTGRTVVGATGGTPTGTVGNTADSSLGSFQPWTSAAISGSFAGGFILASGATGSDVRLDNLPVVVIRFQTDSALTNVRYQIGLTNAAIGTTDAPNTNQVILLRYSTNVPDSGWVIYSANGTSGTTTASVGSIAVSTAYTVMFRAISSSSVEVWLGTSESDLALVSTVTATLPAATTSLIGILQLTTLAATSRIMYFGHYDQSSI